MDNILKSTFPSYRIYNASNKTNEEKQKIIQLCITIPTILMYALRNDTNEEFFKIYEEQHNLDHKISHLFF